MRKIGRYRRRKQKKIIVMGSLSILLFLCAGYAAFSTKLSISATGNIKEKSRVIQSWTGTDQTDFHSDFYKQNIVSATFLDNNKVPSNAAESWNVSEDKENGEVLAWVVPNSSDNTKYDLYIGAKGGIIANEDSSNLFFNFQNIKEINFNNNFDTRNVTEMHNIFCDNWNLIKINFGETFITSNVMDMSGMFARCYKLENIDLSNFNTRNVIDMNCMFWGCSTLSSLDISNFETTNVTNMSAMFRDCEKIISLDLVNFDTKNVTNMRFMFHGCSSLTTLDISSFNTSLVKDMEALFARCEKLQILDISNFNTSNVTNMRDMFSYNSNLTEIIGLDKINTSNVTNMIGMFNYDGNLTSLNLCSFDTRNVTNMELIFANTTHLQKIYVGPNWIIDNATTNNMFMGSGLSAVTTGQC